MNYKLNEEKLSKQAEEVLSKDARELLNEELEDVFGGNCDCHNNSHCKKKT